MRFPRLLTCLLLLNTGLLAAVIFFSITCTAGVPWNGLPAPVLVVSDAGWTYLIGTLLFTESILAFSLFGVKAAYAVIVVFCFATAMLAPVLSPVDECWHLSYIRYVARHGGIPSIHEPMGWAERAIAWGTYPSPVSNSAFSEMFPEKRLSPAVIKAAFQPPLYYAVMAVPFLFLPDNLVHALFGLRLLGTVMLLVTAVFLKRTLDLLSEPHVRTEDRSLVGFLQFGVVCLICLNPGIVHRMTILGNVQIGILLASVLSYWLFRMMMAQSDKTYEVVILGFLSGLLALSHYYSIVFFPIIGLWLLLYRGAKQLLLYMCIVGVLIMPWLLHNHVTYGTIMAAEVAKNDGLKIGLGLEPYGMREAWQMLMINVSRFFLAQESYIFSGVRSGVEGLAHYLAFGSLLAAAFCVADRVLRWGSDDGQEKARRAFLSFAASVVVGTLLLLLAVSYHSQLGLFARYGYLMLPSLGALVYAAVARAPQSAQALVASFMVFFVAVSSANAAAVNIQYTDLIPRSLGQTYRICWLEIEPDERPNVVPLGSAKFSQSFRSDYDQLCGISLFLCPCSPDATQRYTFSVSEDGGRVLRETEFNLSKVKECSYQDIVFDPIPDSRGRSFSLTVNSSEPTGDRAAVLPLSKPGAYQFGSAQVDGRPIKEHAVFDTIFRYDFWSTAVPMANNESPSAPPRIRGNFLRSRSALKFNTNENVGPIVAKGFQQWFVADSDNLCGIRVLINTYLKWPVSSYRMQLLDEHGTVIREATMPGDKMHDWQFTTARFRPVADSSGKRFAFAIIPAARVVEAPITLPLASPDLYLEGHALINGTHTTRNVVFDTVFKRQVHEEFQRSWKGEECPKEKGTEGS